MLTLLAFQTLLISCSNGNSPQKVTNEIRTNSVRLIRIDYPINGSMFDLGDNIKIDLSLLNDSIQLDSVVFFVDNERVGVFNGLSIQFNTSHLKLGTRQLRTTAWHKGERQTASVGVKLKSNISPRRLSYRVINTYPHDKQAYTQGLFFYDGHLIESTGQPGESTLRRVELKTGKVIQSVNLERQYFGEGATLFNDKIYQLTYTSRKGFVYDAKTFQLIRSFDYITQGWGLVSYGDKLIMSDGSNILYVNEPESFTEVSRIEVFDNNGPVNYLNEMEIINGKIWANVYQSNRIVIIEPTTGIVEAEVDFTGILKKEDTHRNIDVFNGIAWDEKSNRLFVTGKYWPKLFEVEVF